MRYRLVPNSFRTETRADYDVHCDDVKIGRIYNGAGANGDKWLWALAGWGSSLADDLYGPDGATQKLKAQHQRNLDAKASPADHPREP